LSGDVRTRDRTFTAWVAGLTLAVVLVGFSRSFFLRPFFASSPSWAAKEAIFYAHGAVFASWFALLAAQVMLIRTKNVRLHRRLGYAGAGLGALVFAVGVLAGLRASNRPGGFIDVPLPPDQFLAVPLLGMLVFGGLVLAAVLWRRDPARHKRLMLLACIDLLGAPVARITSMAGSLAPPALDIIVFTALVALMLAWDAATQRRVRADTLIGGLLVVGVNAAAVPIGATAAWLAIAHRLMALVPPP
jgi:uncharacterized membrane protein YozB (DUF420 family)